MIEPTRGNRNRRCANCGTTLASDNTARLCGKCHREQRDQLRTPPTKLNDEFFETEQFRAAFESQHIGKVFKAYRNHPRHFQIFGKALNQELLGRWLGLTQAQVSKLENGKPEQNLETLQNFAKILHLPQQMLWFDLPGQSRWKSQRDVSTGTRFLQHVDQSRQAMDGALAQGTITSAQVDNIGEMIGLHARDCVTETPFEMLRRLTLDFGDLQKLISRPQSPTVLTRLYSHAAQISALVADELMVVGDSHRAWAWHRTATVAADEVGFPELRLQVNSLGILIPLYYGDLDVALKMAAAASDLGDSRKNRSSPAHSLAVTLKALIEAQVGLKSEAQKTLEDSGEVFDRLARTDRADSVFGFSERRWRFYRARTLAELQDFDAAWEAQEQALNLYPADVVGDPTIIQLDRARCLVQKGEIDTGCELASNAILKLPPEHRVKIFLRYGNRALAAIPEKHSTMQAVVRYRELLAESHRVLNG